VYISRHGHSFGVYGYVIKGEWKYLDHNWIAKEVHFIYEPPGETHTLVVDAHVEEMITLFHITGCMYYVDEKN